MTTNGQQPQQQQQIDLRQEFAITLQLGTWNTVLAYIAKQPWDQADPLMSEIRRQITIVLQGTQQRVPPPANGPLLAPDAE